MSAHGWLTWDAEGEAVLLGADGYTHVAGAGRRPGGYCGWIWAEGAMGTLRMVQTDTVATLEDACRAAEELLHARRLGVERWHPAAATDASAGGRYLRCGCEQCEGARSRVMIDPAVLRTHRAALDQALRDSAVALDHMRHLLASWPTQGPALSALPGAYVAAMEEVERVVVLMDEVSADSACRCPDCGRPHAAPGK